MADDSTDGLYFPPSIPKVTGKVVFQHDLAKPCNCKTCQTQHRLDEAEHKARLVVEAQAAQWNAKILAGADDYVDDHAGEPHGTIVGRKAVLPGYEKLAAILDEALEQAQAGKGKERHATGQPFHEQPIVAIATLLGTSDFNLGQVMKKLQESKRLPPDRRRAERLGAINYIVASILVDEALDEKGTK